MARFTYRALSLATSLLLTPCAGAAVLNFEADGQYDGNFRMLEREWTTVTIAQSANGEAANDYVRVTGNGNSRYTTVYDTTPVDATQRTSFGSGLAVEFDARIPYADRSIGIYLIDANNATEAAGYLALFNVDNAGGDRMRFASNAVPYPNGGAGTLGNELFGNSGYNISTTDFVHVKLIYTINASNQPVLDFTVGNLSKTVTFATTAYSQVEVALRLSPYVTAPTNYLDIDNFTATVPEPASLTLGAMGLLLLSRRRR